MTKLSKECISKFYDDVSKNLNRYTDLHIQIIKLLITEMDDYSETISIVKGHSPYYSFNADYIVEKNGFDYIIVFQILNDFVKDGLLWISERLPETTVFSLTERGNNCFKRIIKLSQEKE